MQSIPYLSGQFLLAMPGIGDPRFERSVVAMCAHDPAGALGLCLHLPMDDISVPELMRQLEIDPGDTPEIPVMMGGPVEPQRGFVLHTPDWAGQDTRHVSGRWALTGTRDVLEAIARGRGPRRWMAALGYAGWGEGQLEEELAHNGWFTTPATIDLLWETPPAERWKRGYAIAGVDVSLLSGEAGRA
ncbi:YqgE/AlgH family protein [Sandaracinobacteroides sp. A072]|uniref:YqgE/AlgH family protein n=1 Tax=Sandaracinobacteroides sp. A072 TaxID=3461146 RepID=UPI00404183B9